MRSRHLFLLFLFVLGTTSIAVYKKYYKKDKNLQTTEKNYNEIIIEDLKIGDGESADKGLKVKINYKAALEDGFVFDSSLERNEPLIFRVGAKTIIKGLNEGVVGMQVGGKRRVVVPPNLGFGKNTLGGIIPQDSFIIFEIELLEVDGGK